MGWLISARCSIKQILAVRFSPEIQEELFGPLHLWFLEDLFVMSVVFGVLRYCATGRNLSLKERLTAYTQSPKVLAAAPFALSICSAGLLSLNLEAVFAYHNAALPPPARLLYYGFYFFVGVCMALARGRLNAASGAWPFHLALSVPAGLGMLALLTKYLEVGGSVWERLALGGCTALFAWLSTFGWLGFCLRWFDGQRPTIRYLADASYWIYLIHLPVVAFAQLTFHALPIPQVAKFLLVVGITLTLGLLSYSSMIRYTWVGNWLNGPRQRPRPAQPITTEHKLAA
jgi:peptidoglycan/LPS O-acetylase OafA/YrhL